MLMRSLYKTILLSTLFLGLYAPLTVQAASLPSVELEDLTWQEIRDRMQHGTTTILIPTGGTEQNGPHIALGKHNWIVRYTSQQIANQLGDALVAPVIAYVPEGTINPPQGHMNFPGTISLSEANYEGLLEDTARSFKQAGFKTICFLGDSGGNQDGQKAVADKLAREWKSEGVQVLHVSDYYAPKAADLWAEKYKQGSAGPGDHAGFEDAAETMMVHPSGVRPALIKDYSTADTMTTGVVGDPRGASAEYGKTLLKFKIDAAIAQIRAAQVHK